MGSAFRPSGFPILGRPDELSRTIGKPNHVCQPRSCECRERIDWPIPQVAAPGSGHPPVARLCSIDRRDGECGENEFHGYEDEHRSSCGVGCHGSLFVGGFLCAAIRARIVGADGMAIHAQCYNATTTTQFPIWHCREQTKWPVFRGHGENSRAFPSSPWINPREHRERRGAALARRLERRIAGLWVRKATKSGASGT